MDILRTKAHYLANGQFKVKFDTGNVHTLSPSVLEGFEQNPWWYDKAKLIARPIENMSDEEWIYYNENVALSPMLDLSTLDEQEGAKSVEAKIIKEHFMLWFDLGISFKAAQYLIKIGVYPFDQDHFKKGLVLTHEGI